MTPAQRWKHNNPEKVKEISRQYYLKNKDSILQKEKERNKLREKGYTRDRHYKYKYNFSLMEFNNLLAEQEGVCAICKNIETNQTNFAVDHCHTTGKVRGLLCFHCNSALGKFNDDPVLLQRAVDYLNGHK